MNDSCTDIAADALVNDTIIIKQLSPFCTIGNAVAQKNDFIIP